MTEFTTRDGTQIFYKDWGAGQPIVFSHGWPLSSDDWDAQMLFFLHHGYRVIAHDRRGHGRSAQVSEGNDMDHYADDLADLTNPDRSVSCPRPRAGTAICPAQHVRAPPCSPAGPVPRSPAGVVL